ncbi:tetratricopeptide repeat protein (plasmid) [Shinella sp. H4-D48]|uniref:tetratricopeptide repeat protein n=1 Tax=Shinella sp. H4-D48 TaxID=2925841 RepID=UPI001F52E9C9|nr:tetratricopeptide repeat protein [Shinella sp. H4-D48]UNK40596.1 tetratricopeptide repeat protein [Shinella sp. H4-D48]
MTSDYFDLGSYTVTVTTSSADAELWFNRGLMLCYAFNHQEAYECFNRAIAADPGCAIAYWGKAFVLGCNYNKPWAAFDPVDAAKSIDEAFAMTQKAMALREGTTLVERLLIEALPTRYQSGSPGGDLDQWNNDFANAMRKAYEQLPGNLEIAALFAEAMMNRTPWQLWDINKGTIAEGADTQEVLDVLEKALANGGMSHPGTLHMYIHAMEMSPHPERALAAANALRNLVPDAGHLNHMPSHIDVLVGDYVAAIDANSKAIEADKKYLELRGPINFYSLYRCHNFHFKIYGAMFAGQYQTAITTADEMLATLPEELLRVESPPMADWLESFVSVKQHVLVRFGRWKEIIAQELPSDQTLFSVTTAMIWYAKAVAHGVLGNVVEAKACAGEFDAALARVQESRYLFNNRCIDILAVAREMMLGEIAYRERAYPEAFEHLRNAVALDDALPYDEPWGWMQPARHALGALMLEQGHVEKSLAVYEADLGLNASLPRACQHPDNIWSLKGYHECLQKLGRFEEATTIRGKIDKLEQNSDVAIRFSCFCRKA